MKTSKLTFGSINVLSCYTLLRYSALNSRMDVVNEPYTIPTQLVSVLDNSMKRHPTTTPRIVCLEDTPPRPQSERKRVLGRTPHVNESPGNPYYAPLPINQSMCEKQSAQQQNAMPTCNSVHEMDLASSLSSNSLRLLGKGAFRVALLHD